MLVSTLSSMATWVTGCPSAPKPQLPSPNAATPSGCRHTHAHTETYTHIFAVHIQFNKKISHFMLDSHSAVSVHIYTPLLMHVHTHISSLPKPMTMTQTANLGGYYSIFIKKKTGKHRDQPRPEIDGWRWWFWQAGWSRSLNGFIQEEIRNTQSLKCALSFQGWSQNKQQRRRNLSIIKTTNPLPGWWWPWAVHVSRDCAAFMFRSLCVLKWISGQKYKSLQGTQGWL